MSSYDPAWLDRMYNNRALVPEHAAFFERWARASAQARELDCELDVAYGDGAGETLDVFPSGPPGAPVLVFIHGGYWRALDKSDHSFIAPAFTRDGACVVIPNYALCPAITVPGIAVQMVKALAWTWHRIAAYGGDPNRIVVAGHSAGGHLAALLAACEWHKWDPQLPPDLVKRALSISGLHDLEPIMHTPFLQPSLQLTPADARRASPALLPAPAQACLYAVAGGDESEEFHRQCRLMREAWGSRRVPVCEMLAGLNHFSILDAFTDPAHQLHRYTLDLLQA
ncbi:alpha/beta hydrolase [Ramlibacter albus]|uniref:Alpha/beta hydrolase n=1 Tax=Ramlibacter albus TaxID=2079448 RepID=A0A923M9G1_9BURK|nr:alpha/beta hydrolase [Ramlibacter albus]MBC5766737.1 alpha/beta hydrolase [Ramlibacter albus]